MRRLTHSDVDVDALISTSGVAFYNPAYEGTEIVHLPAEWNGEMKDGDIAIDLDAGGRGLKGQIDENGTRHSSFELVVTKFAGPGERQLVEPLIKIIDAHDAYGDPYLYLYPSLKLETRMLLNELGLLMFYRSLRSTSGYRDAPEEGERQLHKLFDAFFRGFRANRMRLFAGKSTHMDDVLDFDEALAIGAHRRYTRQVDAIPELKRGRWTGRMKDRAVVIEDVGELRNGSLFGQVLDGLLDDGNINQAEIDLVRPLIDLMDIYKDNYRPFEVICKGVSELDWNDIALLNDTSLVACFEGLRRTVSDSDRDHLNYELIDVATRILHAYRKNRIKACEAHSLVKKTLAGEKTPLTFLPSGQVVVIDNLKDNHRLNDVLFNYYGVRAVVIRKGNNLIIRRADGERVRMDHKDILHPILLAGELDSLDPGTVEQYNGEWFVHSGGWLVAYGTKKSELKKFPSMVDPMILARAVERHLLNNPR